MLGVLPYLYCITVQIILKKKKWITNKTVTQCSKHCSVICFILVGYLFFSQRLLIFFQITVAACCLLLHWAWNQEVRSYRAKMACSRLFRSRRRVTASQEDDQNTGNTDRTRSAQPNMTLESVWLERWVELAYLKCPGTNYRMAQCVTFIPP